MVKLDLGGALWRRRNVISSYEISWGFLYIQRQNVEIS